MALTSKSPHKPLLGVAALGVGLAFVAISSADESTQTSTLSWDAPAECSRATFEQRLPKYAAGSPIHVQIVANSGAAGFVGTVEVGAASRKVAARDCREVASSLGLATAMMLDMAPVYPAHDAGTDASPPDSTDAAAPERNTRPQAAPSSIDWTFATLAITGESVGGQFAAGPSFGVHVVQRHGTVGFGFGVDATYLGFGTEAVGYSVEWHQLKLQPSLCAIAGTSVFEFAGCGALEGGAIWATAVQGVADQTNGTRPWFASGGRLRARVVLGPQDASLRATLGLEGALMLAWTQPRYLVQDGPVLLEIAPWVPSARIFAGIQFR